MRRQANRIKHTIPGVGQKFIWFSLVTVLESKKTYVKIEGIGGYE